MRRILGGLSYRQVWWYIMMVKDDGIHVFHVLPMLELVKRMLDDMDHFMQCVSSINE